MKYGIGYIGSKNKLAPRLMEFIPKGKRFVDLFGGGGAMTHYAIVNNKGYEKFLYNDIGKIANLFEYAVNGGLSKEDYKPVWVSREHFFERRDIEDCGFIKYVWSFCNNGLDYMFHKNYEHIREAVHKYVVFREKNEFIDCYLDGVDNFVTAKDWKTRLKQYLNFVRDSEVKECLIELLGEREYIEIQRSDQLSRIERLQNLSGLGGDKLEISRISYLDYEYQDGDIVYCDPPYNEKEVKSFYEKKFDFEKFLDWADKAEFPIFFSSYSLKDDRFESIWNSNRITSYAQATKVATENLFVNKIAKQILQK